VHGPLEAADRAVADPARVRSPPRPPCRSETRSVRARARSPPRPGRSCHGLTPCVRSLRPWWWARWTGRWNDAGTRRSTWSARCARPTGCWRRHDDPRGRRGAGDLEGHQSPLVQPV